MYINKGGHFTVGKNIFITEDDESIRALIKVALEGYDVHAFDYIIKPAPPSRITDILKRLNDTVNEYTITINKNHTVINIPASSLIYAEARGHNVYIHTNSATYKVYMSFKDFIDLLPDNKSFFVYSRGALVNFENVISISNDI